MDGVLLGLGQLIRSLPNIDSPDSEVADWYEAKARFLTNIVVAADVTEAEAACAAAQGKCRQGTCGALRDVELGYADHERDDEVGRRSALPLLRPRFRPQADGGDPDTVKAVVEHRDLRATWNPALVRQGGEVDELGIGPQRQHRSRYQAGDRARRAVVATFGHPSGRVAG